MDVESDPRLPLVPNTLRPFISLALSSGETHVWRKLPGHEDRHLGYITDYTSIGKGFDVSIWTGLEGGFPLGRQETIEEAVASLAGVSEEKLDVVINGAWAPKPRPPYDPWLDDPYAGMTGNERRAQQGLEWLYEFKTETRREENERMTRTYGPNWRRRR